MCAWVVLVIVAMMISCGGDAKPTTPKARSTGDDMIDRITQKISAEPDNADLLYERAVRLYEKDEYEASIADLEAALGIDSLQAKYYHLLSDNYLDYYRSRKALDMMESAARLFPERIPTLLKLSEVQMILGQFENSVYTVNEILRLDPQNNEAFFMLGMNFRALGQMEKAINSFQTAVENDPEMIDAWLILGELHEKNGTGKPLQFYENALRIAPDNPQVIHSKAFYLQNNGRIPEALELYQEINQKDPQYTDAYLNAGILYMEMDSFQLAFEQMNILAGIQPENPSAYYYRGLIHKAYGNYEAAAIDMQNSVNLGPNFQAAKDELALVKAELSRVK